MREISEVYQEGSYFKLIFEDGTSRHISKAGSYELLGWTDDAFVVYDRDGVYSFDPEGDRVGSRIPLSDGLEPEKVTPGGILIRDNARELMMKYSFDGDLISTRQLF